jgi:hypothetical protein
MSTEKQIEANKQNASKSTGPRTIRGKAKTSRNAIRHGLRSKFNDILLDRENKKLYYRFYKSLSTDLAPVGPKEIILADRIINFYWKLKRVSRMETQTFDILRYKAFDSNPLIKRYRDLHAKNAPIPKDLDVATDKIQQNMLGGMAVDNFASHSQEAGRSLENIQLYESRIERSLYKAQLEFQKLQFIRRQKEAELRNEANSDCHPREGGDPDSSKNETNPTISPECNRRDKFAS